MCVSFRRTAYDLQRSYILHETQGMSKEVTDLIPKTGRIIDWIAPWSDHPGRAFDRPEKRPTFRLTGLGAPVVSSLIRTVQLSMGRSPMASILASSRPLCNAITSPYTDQTVPGLLDSARFVRQCHVGLVPPTLQWHLVTPYLPDSAMLVPPTLQCHHVTPGLSNTYQYSRVSV